MAGSADGQKSQQSRLRPATAQRVLARLPRLVYMNHRWQAYLPIWLVAWLFEKYGGTVSHVILYPDDETGQVYLTGGKAGDVGAQEILFKPARTTGWISLYLAVAPMNKRVVKGRRLQIPVCEDALPGTDQVALRFDISAAKSVVGESLGEEQEKAGQQVGVTSDPVS